MTFSFLKGLNMIFTSLALVFLASFGATQQDSEGARVTNLLPDLTEPDVPQLPFLGSALGTRGRSDIDIEEDAKPSRGYFYPKPAKPFNLPEFKTLDANVPLDGVSTEDTEGVERVRRSPHRGRPQYYPHYPHHPHRPPPPNFRPGSSLLPHHIRPLPALYGRPQRF